MTPLAWAAAAWGRDVTAARPLTGGWTSTMLALEATDGARAVLRLMTREPWRTHAAGLLAREADVQRLLAGTPVPAPASWALDPDGTATGDPAHLMSWLPGSLVLDRADDGLLRALAAMLRTVHRVDPGADRPRAYQSWAPPAKRIVPAWASDPSVWRAAFAVLDGPEPAYEPTFLHRDFHLGNVLWTGDEITGVVDWVETSWGPVGLDVAHAATCLALLHGSDAASAFGDHYIDLGGLLPDQRYWDVLDAVGYLPDPTKVATPWREAGRDITDDQARRRLEEHLARVLDD
ncbi:MAG: aminoglycoside phosphotransferase family protein [Nocardioides sp.]